MRRAIKWLYCEPKSKIATDWCEARKIAAGLVAIASYAAQARAHGCHDFNTVATQKLTTEDN